MIHRRLRIGGVVLLMCLVVAGCESREAKEARLKQVTDEARAQVQAELAAQEKAFQKRIADGPRLSADTFSQVMESHVYAEEKEEGQGARGDARNH
jgi:Tfp pilus assembly protein PilP